MWPGKGKCAIAGVGFSEISRRTDIPLAQLVLQASSAALADAAVSPGDVDGIATFPSAGFRGSVEEGVHTVGVSYLLDHLPGLSSVNWFGECSAGLVGSALIEAVHALLAGTCRVVLVWRGMSLPAGSYNAAPKGRIGGQAAYYAPFGLHAAVQTHALAYQRYMWRYGATREEMATLATNSRHNATLSDLAYFRDRPLTIDDYLSSRPISSPLCLYDCDIPVQGAAALVLTLAERAADGPHPPAFIWGMAQQTSQQPHHGSALYSLLDYVELGARTAQALWTAAGVGPRDVHVAQLYDGFSPSVYYWLEAAGFCQEGEAHSFIQDGRIALTGTLPINTFGGSLSEGRMHGMGHIIEGVRQVTGRADRRQVRGAKLAAIFDGSPMLRGSAVVLGAERS